MRCETFSIESFLSPCDCLVVGLDSAWGESEEISKLDAATNGLIRRLIEAEEISTKPLKITQLLAPAGLPMKLLLLVGLGAHDSKDTSVSSRAAATAFKAIASKKRGVVRVVGFKGTALAIRGAVSGAMIGCVGQDLFRKEKSLQAPDCIQWAGIDEATVQSGMILGEAINFSRRLVNLPPNYLFPESLADEAIQLGKRQSLEVDVWDRSKLETEGCGALLGVARGSVRDPRLVIMRYCGAEAGDAPTVLVGKGVTFDSGGYSIKPTDGMLTMKCDMAGAATVLGIMQAAVQLKVKHNLVAIIGLVENLISGDAFKLGDVLTARSGKTIEIHNTDAEGRLVLADCLNVALDHKPRSDASSITTPPGSTPKDPIPDSALARPTRSTSVRFQRAGVRGSRRELGGRAVRPARCRMRSFEAVPALCSSFTSSIAAGGSICPS